MAISDMKGWMLPCWRPNSIKTRIETILGLILWHCRQTTELSWWWQPCGKRHKNGSFSFQVGKSPSLDGRPSFPSPPLMGGVRGGWDKPFISFFIFLPFYCMLPTIYFNYNTFFKADKIYYIISNWLLLLNLNPSNCFALKYRHNNLSASVNLFLNYP